MKEQKRKWKVSRSGNAFIIDCLVDGEIVIDDFTKRMDEIERRLNASEELEGLRNKYSEDGQAYQGPEFWRDRLDCMERQLQQAQDDRDELIKKAIHNTTILMDVAYEDYCEHAVAIEDLATRKEIEGAT